ncbi:MAG: YciI family protein [Magnetococcus sp. WYHC-3]
MVYAIICTDRSNSLPLRRETRPRHLARLEALKAEGRLILAGPFPAADSTDPGEDGFTGSLIVASFASFEEADAWAQADPYREAGVYQDVAVLPFIPVLP